MKREDFKYLMLITDFPCSFLIFNYVLFRVNCRISIRF